MSMIEDLTDDDLKNPTHLRNAVFALRDFGTTTKVDLMGAVLTYIDDHEDKEHSSCFQDVGKFHRQMELPLFTDQAPHLLRHDEFNFRTAAMFEELREFIECHALKDLAGAADALVDLVYFAMGTAHYMGLPFDECWAAVQRANMAKRRWQPGDPVKPRNGTSLDVIKPDGWRAPDLMQLLWDHKDQVLRNQGVRP